MDVAILELFLNTKQQIKLSAYLLLKIDSPFLEKLLLPHVQILPDSFQKRQLIFKKYPELRRLVKKTQIITKKNHPVSTLKKDSDDFS